jgi:hypothetical protein
MMVHQEAATGKDAAVQAQTSSSVNIEILSKVVYGK